MQPVATSGRSLTPQETANHAKTVAMRCEHLPKEFHGKEGIELEPDLNVAAGSTARPHTPSRYTIERPTDPAPDPRVFSRKRD